MHLILKYSINKKDKYILDSLSQLGLSDVRGNAKYKEAAPDLVGTVVWRISSYYRSSFSPIFNHCGAIINPYLTTPNLKFSSPCGTIINPYLTTP